MTATESAQTGETPEERRSGHLSHQASQTASPWVARWLFFTCGMIFAMAVIGAITRLTESGLSIMEWAPLSGALPPLSGSEWERLFELYKQTPEYQQLNAGMSLAEFRGIFWWEWVHRLWGRLIGIVFALPYLWFLVRGQLGGLKGKLFLALLLGAAQGALGWYMVASGFAQRTDVSQYRLVAHLALALAIFAYLLWIAFDLVRRDGERERAPMGFKAAAWAFLALLTVTLTAGGFVAGLNAGLIYNSFPWMDGDFIPADYVATSPFIANFFESVAAVQFNHRWLAVATVLFALALWLWARKAEAGPKLSRDASLLALMALVQLALGIATLLLIVPIWLAALHQAGAIMLLAIAVSLLHRIHGDSRGATAP